MIIRKRFNNKLIKNSRLLNIYISLLNDLYPRKSFTFQEIKNLLKEEFNYETSLEDIANYYEPNFYENRLDVEQQMKNLGIKYG